VQLASIQPRGLWINMLTMLPNAAFRPLPQRPRQSNTNATAQIQRLPDKSFRCWLTLQVQAGASLADLPYFVGMQVMADFVAFEAPGPDESVITRSVCHNGLAMLYGFARDTLLNLTTSALNGPLLLPAVNLTDLAEQLQRSVEQIQPSA